MIKFVKLGDVCLVRRGTTITRKQTKKGNVPVIAGGRKATYFHSEHNRESGTITVSGSGASAGLVNYWSIPIFASDCSTVELKDNKQNAKFIYYYMQSMQEFIYKDMRSGAAQPHVYAKDIANLNFPLFSLEEQQCIVAKLDAAFAEIDKLIEIEKIKIKNIKKFNSEFISNQLSKLSDKDLKKLSDISNLTRGPFGGSITKGMFVKDGYAIYEQKHAIRNNFENIKYFINQEKFNDLKRFELKSGDLLMSCSGTMGKIAIVPKNIKKGIINQALLKITPNEKIVLKEYLKLIISSDYFQKLLASLSSGAAQINVPSVKILKNINMPVPSIQTQSQILEKILFIDNLQLENLYKKKEILFNSLKSSVIKNLMSKDSEAA